VRRVQFHSLQINNDKRASVLLHPASPASCNTGDPECPGGRDGRACKLCQTCCCLASRWLGSPSGGWDQRLLFEVQVGL